MKTMMKFSIVLVVLAMTTSLVSAAPIWWDNDNATDRWIDPGATPGINWNEGEFVDVIVPAVPGYMDDNGTPGDPLDDFWVPGVPEYTIPGYGNNIAPVLGQNVDLRNIAVTTTNVGEAGLINVNIGALDTAEVGHLFIGRVSFNSDAVTVTVNGGSLTTLGHIKMGEVDGDVAVLNLINGATLNITDPIGNSHLHIGYGKDGPNDGAFGDKTSAAESGGVATFNMAAGTSLVVDQDIEVTYFAGGTGTGVVAGNITVYDDFRVAGNDHQQEGTSVGYWTMNAGAVMTVADDTEWGRYGTATVVMNGNSDLSLGDDLKLGETNTGTFTMNDDSFFWIDDDLYAGRYGNATININDNANMYVEDDIELGQSTGTGVMNMTGGTVYVKDSFEMTKSEAGDVGGSSTLNMSGGELNVKLFKMAQKGGSATVNLKKGLIIARENFAVPYNGDDPTITDQTGTVAHLTIGDAAGGAIVQGDATINTAEFNMDNAYAVGGNLVDVWVDFQPGGLLTIDGDVRGDIQTLIDDGMLLTTYVGDWFGFYATGSVGYDYNGTSAGQTSVYLTSVPSVFCVDDDATGNNDGSGWSDAFTELQSALDAAVAGDEIWVAEGTYYPTVAVGGAGERYKAFQLKNGVTVKGGYAGYDAADPDARDVALYETVLSGDLNGDDDSGGDNSENSYHVFHHPDGTNLDATAILDGFTISGGNADGSWPEDDGGGMYNGGSSPTVISCTFINNSAEYGGGGMYNENASSPMVTNCIFTGNIADYGGGMDNHTNCNPTVTNCTFTGNIAAFGGGMDNFINCNPTVTNCTFTGNTANYGGGMGNYVNDNPTASNCIFWGNSAIGGNAIYNSSSTPVISYCDIAGSGGSGAWDSSLGTDGGGNIDVDPEFVDADGADNVAGTEDDDLRLSSSSPCIDAGDNSVVTEPNDLDGLERIVDGDCDSTATVDMGAYEFDWLYVGDFAGGCDVVLSDFGVLAESWGADNPSIDIWPYPAGDGVIDLGELAVLAAHYLEGAI